MCKRVWPVRVRRSKDPLLSLLFIVSTACCVTCLKYRVVVFQAQPAETASDGVPDVLPSALHLLHHPHPLAG